MNILFIGPYRQADGWGEAARSYLRALIRTTHNIAARPVYMGSTIHTPGPDILDLEDIECSEYDVVIQNVLPHMLTRVEGAKNIGLFYLETKNIDWTPWPDACSSMDEIWVSSVDECKVLENAGVSVPVHSMPIPVDVDKYRSVDYTRFPLSKLDNHFNIYFIGEFIPRKNIHALLVAFHREFTNDEPVNLVIKTYLGNMHPQVLLQQVNQQFLDIKKILRIYPDPNMYRQEIVVVDRLSTEDLMGLHRACQLFVMPSRGEACCQPLLDAIGMGNRALVTEGTSMESIVHSCLNRGPYLIKAHETPVYSKQAPLPFIYTGRETWMEVDLLNLQRRLRTHFNEWKKDPDKYWADTVNRVDFLSYDSIAEKMRGVL